MIRHGEYKTHLLDNATDAFNEVFGHICETIDKVESELLPVTTQMERTEIEERVGRAIYALEELKIKLK